jgi:hypothetical protein
MGISVWLLIPPGFYSHPLALIHYCRAEVTVAVTLERDLRSLDPGQLQWGVERIMDTGVESIGTANQAFVIDAQQ